MSVISLALVSRLGSGKVVRDLTNELRGIDPVMIGSNEGDRSLVNDLGRVGRWLVLSLRLRLVDRNESALLGLEGFSGHCRRPCLGKRHLAAPRSGLNIECLRDRYSNGALPSHPGKLSMATMIPGSTVEMARTGIHMIVNISRAEAYPSATQRWKPNGYGARRHGRSRRM